MIRSQFGPTCFNCACVFRGLQPRNLSISMAAEFSPAPTVPTVAAATVATVAPSTATARSCLSKRTREEEPVQQDSLVDNAILQLRERLAGNRRGALAGNRRGAATATGGATSTLAALNLEWDSLGFSRVLEEKARRAMTTSNPSCLSDPWGPVASP